jgi:hypothetical protein
MMGCEPLARIVGRVLTVEMMAAAPQPQLISNNISFLVGVLCMVLCAVSSCNSMLGLTHLFIRNTAVQWKIRSYWLIMRRITLCHI